MPIIYSILPSLKHIAEVSVAISVWSQCDVQNLPKVKYLRPRGIESIHWQKLEKKVIEEVQNLPLPTLLKQEVSAMIKPIGVRLLSWMNFNRECPSAVKLLKEFCWTPQGTIDAKRTAEALVVNDKLSINERYVLACNNCLEDYIYVLREQLDKPYKEDLSTPRLVSFWSHDYSHEDVLSYEYAFHVSVATGNLVATRYFFQELFKNDVYKDKILLNIANHAAQKCYTLYSNYDDLFFLESYHTDVLCFLVSNLNDEQQVECFKKYPFIILKCMLEWPWQGFFARTAQYIWSFLGEEYSHTFDVLSSMECMYIKLLNDIIGKVVLKDYNYEELFYVFWNQIPDIHKRCIFLAFSGGFCLPTLLELEWTDLIKQILNDATTAEKVNIICAVGIYNFKEILRLDKLHLYKFFVEQCISSKEMMIEYKKKIDENDRYLQKDVWSKMSQVVDGLIQAYDKRKNLEDDCAAKKFCVHDLRT